MRRVATAYGAGLLFGIGLALSGMIDPRNVVAFLDIGGRWSPNLAAVMIGAIGVHAVLLRWLAARAPARATTVASAARVEHRPGPGIDRRVVIGSAIFGVGWGIAGYCPGPAIVALGFGAGRTWAFVVAMAAGALLAEWIATAGKGREVADGGAGLRDAAMAASLHRSG